MKIIAAVLCLLCACTSSGEKPVVEQPTAPTVIGVDLDKSGSIATPSWWVSVALAVGTMNEALRQAGLPARFQIAEGNSGNDAASARASALELVEKQHARALITDSSQDDIAIHVLAYDGHGLSVPIVCMGCTSGQINSPEATDVDPARQAALRNERGWNFRTSMSDAYQARTLVRVLLSRGKRGDVNGDHKVRFAVFATSDNYGRNFSDAIRGLVTRERPDAQVEQVFVEPNAPATHDYGADVRQLVAHHPDAVIEITFPKIAIGFTRAWLAAKPATALLHTHNFRSARVIEALKDALEGEEGTSQVTVAEGVSGSAFAADLHARSGQDPAFRDSTAYDAAMTLMLATLIAQQKAGRGDVSGAAIRDSMRATHAAGGTRVSAGGDGIVAAVKLIAARVPVDYDGASGPCLFDGHGDVTAQLARFTVRGGRFIDLERFDCIAAPDCPVVAVR